MLGVLLAIGVLTSQLSNPTSPRITGAPPPPSESPDETALRKVRLTKFSWYKGGFESVMMAKFVIANDNDVAVKDITIRCQHAGKSGTEIDSNTRTIYDTVKAHSKRTFREFNMGLIHSQAATSGCSIISVKVAS